LERSGLVGRRGYAEGPPRVEYRLTELGSTLIPALTGLHEWAERYGAAVDEHWRRGAGGTTEERGAGLPRGRASSLGAPPDRSFQVSARPALAGDHSPYLGPRHATLADLP